MRYSLLKTEHYKNLGLTKSQLKEIRAFRDVYLNNKQLNIMLENQIRNSCSEEKE